MRLRASNWVRDEDGSTMPIFVLSLMAIMALVGATIALGMDSRAAGNLQATADSAALSGATAFINITSPKSDDRLREAHRLAKSIAEGNSEYIIRELDVNAVVEDPYGQHTRIDVEVGFEPTNAMAKIAGRNASVAITRRASAEATWGFPLCILALEENNPGLITYDDITLHAENCIIWANSDKQDSLDFNGGDIVTKHFCTAGKAAMTNGAHASPLPTENCDAIPDPLHDWTPPPAGTLSSTPGELFMPNRDVIQMWLENLYPEQDYEPVPADRDMSGPAAQTRMSDTISLLSGGGGLGGPPPGFPTGGGSFLSPEEAAQLLGHLDNVNPALYAGDSYATSPTETLSPGTFNGLDISQGHVKFNPGTYHIVDAPLVVRRRATLTGEGVTIILHGDGASLSVLDEARLTLTAPLDGPTAGFALAEDRYISVPADHLQRSRLTGSGRVNAIGTIYLPRQSLSISGDGAADQASPLLQIVANTVDMSNSGGLKIIFDTSQTDVPVAIKPQRTARLIY